MFKTLSSSFCSRLFSDPKKLKEKLIGDVRKNSVTLNELNKKLNASKDQAKSFKTNIVNSSKEDNSDYNYYKNQRVSPKTLIICSLTRQLEINYLHLFLENDGMESIQRD